MANLFKEIWWWIKKVPFTIAIILANIIAGIVTKALWTSAETSGLVDRLGWGLPAFRNGDFTGVITGLLVAPAPWMYGLILIPVAIGAGFIEYKYGALRMLATLLITHVVSVLVVALLLLALEPTHLPWVIEFRGLHDVGLSNAGFGALGTMTAALALLWRRRLRTLLFLYCLAFILFSGAIWDLTHFVALLTGFAIGPWVVKRKYEKFSYKLGKQESRSLVATLAVFFVITRVVSKVYPGNGGLLAFHNYDMQDASTILLTLALYTISLLLAYGLYAGRKIAWKFSIAAIIFLALATLYLPMIAATIFNLIFCAAMLVLLIVFRKAFDVEADKITRKNIYKRLLILGAGLLIFNAIAIYAIRTSFTPTPSFSDAIAESIYQIIGISTRSFHPVTGTARALTDSISISWSVVVFLSFVAIIFATVRQRDQARSSFDAYDKILHDKGCSTIGFMTRWPKISYWVNSSQTAGFAYRLENNFAIVLSDPVGSRQAVASSFESFENMCLRRGWHPIYYAVSDKFCRSVSKQNLKKIIVGEDTIIDLPALEFTGKKWQSIRSAVNRATKEGIRMRVVKFSEAPIGLRDQLTTIANGWASDKSLPEMEFTLGTLKEAEDPEARMHVAIDEDGTVHGMTSWFPVYKNGKVIGWTIDIMQRRLGNKTMQGVIEFLIAESATTFKQEGYEFISLSAAPLSHSGKSTNAVEMLLDVVAKRMEPYYGFKSLYNYKQKFNPRHEPIYLCYHDEARLPAIALAIGKAYMPDNILRELVASKIKH